MKKKLAIIADDFTGANDTGVQFSKKNLRTVVVTNLNFMEKSLSEADVLVVDTESRFDTAQNAYDKVYQAGSFLAEKKVDYIYKKLDSTFRGNIGAEIAAVMDAAGIELALMAPAFPATGRITLDGKIYLNGALLEDTEIAKDPKTPVKSSSIAEIIRLQTDKKVESIPLKEIEAGPKVLAERIETLHLQGAEIIVFDSDKKENLQVVAEAISLLYQPAILVGSAGLAEYLPAALGLKESADQGRVLVVAGSVSDVTRGQVNFAAANDDQLQVIDVNITELFESDAVLKEHERIVKLTQSIFDQGNDVIIRTARDRGLIEVALAAGKKEGYEPSQASEKIAQFLGEAAQEILSTAKIKGLMLTGGDIAIKVADKLKAQGILIQDEILPGIPYGYFIHERLNTIPVATKAGAFGQEDGIKKTIDFLREETGK